ncbi:hypothetical protein HYR54_06685 [Candidatus Acetothermia bacterium]|nr:hypothetical protein [Candidatus Acetothermia bacterium]
MNTSDPDITLFSQRETTQESALVGKVFLGVASAEALVILLVVAFLASWYRALIAAIAIFGILILTYYQMQVEPTKAPHSLTSQELNYPRLEGEGFGVSSIRN